METSTLEALGFTRAEATVYLTLLNTGSVKVGTIIERSGLQSSTIQYSLISLIEKGFVNYIVKGKMRIYQAVEPRIVLQSFKERELAFESLIPQLELTKKLNQEQTKAEMFEGLNGITKMFDEVLADVSRGEKYYFYAADVPQQEEQIAKFFATRDMKRHEKGLAVRGLAREELRQRYKTRKHLTMRYVNFPIPTSLNLCNDKMIMVSWSEKSTGVIVQSKQLVERQIQFFEEIWKLSKP